MPGLFGVIAKNRGLAGHSLLEMGRRMADSMRHEPWLRTEIWGDQNFCGGRVHLGVLNPQPQPLVTKDKVTRVWFDGELYQNSTESDTPTTEEVCKLVGSPGNGLAEIDGVFSLACYDAERRELVLANDRLGFRPLYYTESRDWFAYAASVKALLAILDRLPALDEVGLRQFFGFHHMFGDRTWWKGIELIPPASIWRISAKGRTAHRYWTFDDIRRDPKDPADVQIEFGRLWSQDVRRHSRPGTMPLLLSGGLDSRLLLAELLTQGADLVAVTFGSEESPEVEPARRVVALAGIPHRLCSLNTQNWWHRREEAIWQTDGLVNGNRFHFASSMDEMHTGNWFSPMNIAGDLLFGGSHLDRNLVTDWPLSLESLLAKKYMENPFFGREEVMSVALADAKQYAHGPSSDCFYLHQEYRRDLLQSIRCLASHCETVFPGMSYALLRLFLGALSDEDRIDHKFYNRFLASRHPRYFGNIPWQVTGRGLAESFPTRLSWHLRGWLRQLPGAIGTSCYLIGSMPLIRPLRRITLIDSAIRSFRPGVELLISVGNGSGPVPSNQWFVNLPECLRENRVREKLLREDLIADAFLGGAARRALVSYQSTPLSTESLMAILTFETYLRQVAGTPNLTSMISVERLAAE